jgi:actin-like ATPase involved in cell morphogenesis
MTDQPLIGIDFGTSRSSVAWFNPATKQAEVLANSDGEQKTPSIVYFGADEVLVGSPAHHMLSQGEDERRRVVTSVKRDLVTLPRLSLPDRQVTMVEAAAEIFKKLKNDAEELRFHHPVTSAVVACPAAFDERQRAKVREAAELARFTKVDMIDEPVAAALAYARMGHDVGSNVLVYDLGGGTFDLAIVRRDDDDSFRLALEPKGLARCGGDDFDRAIYDHLAAAIHDQLGVDITADGRPNLEILDHCRQAKEQLSARDKTTIAVPVETTGGPVPFKCAIDRTLFESLIRDQLDTTVRLTQDLVVEAKGVGIEVDTVVLIGGSSRLPLIYHLLTGAFPLQTRRFDQADVAVALGAAYYADQLGSAKLTPADRYRQALMDLGPDFEWDAQAAQSFQNLQTSFGLQLYDAVEIERAALGYSIRDLAKRAIKEREHSTIRRQTDTFNAVRVQIEREAGEPLVARYKANVQSLMSSDKEWKAKLPTCFEHTVKAFSVDVRAWTQHALDERGIILQAPPLVISLEGGTGANVGEGSGAAGTVGAVLVTAVTFPFHWGLGVVPAAAAGAALGHALFGRGGKGKVLSAVEEAGQAAKAGLIEAAELYLDQLDPQISYYMLVQAEHKKSDLEPSSVSQLRKAARDFGIPIQVAHAIETGFFAGRLESSLYLQSIKAARNEGSLDEQSITKLVVLARRLGLDDKEMLVLEKQVLNMSNTNLV